MTTKRIELLPHQHQFLTDTHKFTMLCGGGGSGKTWAGAHYAINQAVNNSGALGLIGANSYKQLQNVTLQTLFGELDNLGLEFEYIQNKGILNLGESKIICASMDNYDFLRGLELGWIWLDEARDMKEDAFLVLLGRLRDRKSKALQLRATTTPRGFNFLYDYFAGEKKTDEFHAIFASSHDNPFLPDGYLETLQASYDSKLLAQEVAGQFVNVAAGAVYYAFDRSKHVKPTAYDPTKRIHIGIDFNVDPMTCVVAHVDSQNIQVFDEFYLNNSNTTEMITKIVARYGNKALVIPDSTGRARKTASNGLTDHILLEQAGFEIPRVSNPAVFDRFACVNNLFEKGRVTIDPMCTNLIRDLERVSYKEGSNHVDTTQKHLTHISDAFGYLAWFHFPIFNNTSAVRVSRY